MSLVPHNQSSFYPQSSQETTQALNPPSRVYELGGAPTQLSIDYPQRENDESRALAIRRSLPVDIPGGGNSVVVNPSSAAPLQLESQRTMIGQQKRVRETSHLPAPQPPPIKEKGVKRTREAAGVDDDDESSGANTQWRRVHSAARQLKDHIMRNPRIFGVNEEGKIYGNFGRTPAHLYPNSDINKSIETILFPSAKVTLRPPPATKVLLNRLHEDPVASQLIKEALESRPRPSRRQQQPQYQEYSSDDDESNRPTTSSSVTNKGVGKFKPDTWQQQPPPTKKRMNS